MSTGVIIILILLVLCIAASPSWTYSRNFGMFPSSILGIALLVVLILVLTGRL